jgi:predicted PP-loop superfamily ATPase
MSKKKINENMFDAGKKFSDAFFDGVKKNATDRIINKARAAKVDPKIIAQLEKIQKEKEELDKLLGSDD